MAHGYSFTNNFFFLSFSSVNKDSISQAWGVGGLVLVCFFLE